MDSVLVFCPAKINMCLNIVGKAGNMHLIKSINQSIDLYDYLIIKPNMTGKINITCNNSEVPLDESNSCFKAALIMQQTFKIPFGFDIEIIKNIPLCSGLGGKSTDAAGVFLGIKDLFNIDIPINSLIHLAGQIGSDVPFCLIGGTCLVEKTGNRITQTQPLKLGYIVIAKPNFSISSKEAYAKFDRIITQYTDLDDFYFCYNDFHILAPKEIGELRKLFYEHGANYSMMTGSGPAVFGSFSNKQKNLMAYRTLKRLFTDYQIFNAKQCNGIQIVKKSRLN